MNCRARTVCDNKLNPDRFGSARHWCSIPRAIRDRLCEVYRLGRCDDVSRLGYCLAARDKTATAAISEGIDPSTLMWDFLIAQMPVRLWAMKK